jgi:hypothetical protein
MAITRVQFAQAVLQALGQPITPQATNNLVAWQQAEGGNAQYNPLNTTLNLGLPGETTYNSAGVQNYPSYQAGVTATAKTLEEPQYQSVVANLNSSPSAFDATVTSSPWGTHDLTPAVSPINKNIATNPGGSKTPVGQIPPSTGSISIWGLLTGNLKSSGVESYLERALAIVVGIVVVIVGIKMLFGDSASEAIKSTAQAPAKIAEKYGSDAAEVAG